MGHSGRLHTHQGGNRPVRGAFLNLFSRRLTGLILLLVLLQSLPAQEMNGPLKEPLPYQDVEFPQWAHDVRRYEIIMFGSFPLTYILSSLVYETVRLISSEGQSGFSLSSNKSQNDIRNLLITSASLSVGIATADLIIGKSKKKKQKEEEILHIPVPEAPVEEERDE